MGRSQVRVVEVIGGPGFVAAVFARDIAFIIVFSMVLVGIALAFGVGGFLLCEILFGSVS